MLITKFVEVPNTNIQEEVTNDFGYDLCYDMAQQFGHAQLVWYALNGTRVVPTTQDKQTKCHGKIQPYHSKENT